MGVKEPRCLEEWADVGLGSNHLPWLQGEELGTLQNMLNEFLENHRTKSFRG